MVKKVLETVQFQSLVEDRSKETYKSFAKDATWILPQLLAYIGKFPTVKNETGRNDAMLTAKNIVNSYDGWDKNWVKGALLYLKADPRGTIFPSTIKATSVDLLPFSALVPLFLAAFKKYQDVKYMSWDNVHMVVDADLWDTMNSVKPDLSLEQLLYCRKVGSTVKNGKTAGVVKNPVSVTNVNKIEEDGFEDFDNLPRLAKIIMTQTWVAHPSLRHQYMVLDLDDWDVVPKPLIDTEVIKQTSSTDPWGE